MAEDNDLSLQLKIQADQSVKAAADALGKVADAEKEVADNADEAAKATDKVADALSKVLRETALENLARDSAKAAKEGKELKGVITTLRDSLDDFGASDKEVEKVVRQFERLRNIVDEIDPRNIVDEIDPRKVQLDFADASGDRASQTGLARGAISTLAGGNAGAIGQLLEGAEAVFDLGEAAGKAGGPLADVVQKLGPAGIAGAAAAAGVAMVILSKVLEDIQKNTQREVGAVQAASQTILEVNLALEQGITKSEARERIAELNQEIAATVTTIDDVKAAQLKLVDAMGGNLLLAQQTEAYKEFDTQIKNMQDSIGNAELEQRKYQEALDSGILVADEVTKAEKAIDAAREESAQVTTLAANEIKKANEAIATSANRFNRIAGETPIQRAQRLNAGVSSGDTIPPAIRDTAVDAAKSLEEDIQKARADVAIRRVEQRIDHEERLFDIARQFQDSRADALEEQNFLALEQLNTEEARAKRDQLTDNERANREITRDAQRSYQDLQRQQAQYHQQRSQIESQGLTNSLNNVQQWATGLQRITADVARQLQSRRDNRRTQDSQFREVAVIGNQPRSR